METKICWMDGKRIADGKQTDGKRISDGQICHPFAIPSPTVCYPFTIRLLSHPSAFCSWLSPRELIDQQT